MLGTSDGPVSNVLTSAQQSFGQHNECNTQQARPRKSATADVHVTWNRREDERRITMTKRPESALEQWRRCDSILSTKARRDDFRRGFPQRSVFREEARAKRGQVVETLGANVAAALGAHAAGGLENAAADNNTQ